MNLKGSISSSATKAFSLVELLVVMAVILALAGLLLPALVRSREKARLAQCTGNLRQWGLAFRMYADDNDDFLPRRGQGVQPLFQINRTADWFNALPPYFGLNTFEQMISNNTPPVAYASSVFVCPTADDAGGNYFLPYGMNMNLSPWNLPAATKLSQVIQPLLVVAMADTAGNFASTYPSAKPYSPVARHTHRVNLLFLAGQVQAFAGDYAGCGAGDPHHDDLRWLTGTASDAQAPVY